jgi:hypothetical protein
MAFDGALEIISMCIKSDDTRATKPADTAYYYRITCIRVEGHTSKNLREHSH